MASVFVSPVDSTILSRASTDRLVRLTVTFSSGDPPPRPRPGRPPSPLVWTLSLVASLVLLIQLVPSPKLGDVGRRPREIDPPRSRSTADEHAITLPVTCDSTYV